jgi:hypothetical protein
MDGQFKNLMGCSISWGPNSICFERKFFRIPITDPLQLNSVYKSIINYYYLIFTVLILNLNQKNWVIVCLINLEKTLRFAESYYNIYWCDPTFVILFLSLSITPHKKEYLFTANEKISCIRFWYCEVKYILLHNYVGQQS